MLVPAPTRYESVGCDDGRFISPKESQACLLIALRAQPKLNNEVVNPQLSTLNPNP